MSEKHMPSLDTNCLLRWILDDIPEQTTLITGLVNSGESFTIADAALIETIFVLEKITKTSRKSIEEAVIMIIENNSILCNRALFIEILPIYTDHPKLSFVDCYLAVLARRTGSTPLLTFDKKLASQIPGTQLLSP